MDMLGRGLSTLRNWSDVVASYVYWK